MGLESKLKTALKTIAHHLRTRGGKRMRGEKEELAPGVFTVQSDDPCLGHLP